MSTFGWCSSGHHKECRREVRRFIIDPKKNTVVWLDEYSTCECPKRGCECYVPAKDRGKTKTRRRKK